ncbi:hypothetical protein BUY86_11610 [Staphylococcus equorum]|uniref:hypothetical protein n=1 Tax=Staphylococcus equorum TaxID=246432 RepID=UPI000E6A10D1|nr:hypothetical protein [Staphylococcus equorum]RIL33823.1 hypothetical protein BUY86_11610 [Staphylococcus equorum]
MYKDSTFIVLTAVFYSLMTATYLIVSFYVNHINVNNENTRYVAFILITFFFGSVIKSLYAFLIDIHVDFEDELPAMYKKCKKVINGVTDIILVLLMCSFLLQVSDNGFIVTYIFFFGFIMVCLFIYVVFNHKKTRKIKRGKDSKKVKNKNENIIHTSDLNVRKGEKHE